MKEGQIGIEKTADNAINFSLNIPCPLVYACALLKKEGVKINSTAGLLLLYFIKKRPENAVAS